MFTFECGVDSVLSLSFYGNNVIETESDLGERKTIFIVIIVKLIVDLLTLLCCFEGQHKRIKLN